MDNHQTGSAPRLPPPFDSLALEDACLVWANMSVVGDQSGKAALGKRSGALQ
jgi:hypothetical protein